jgi:hypothetical protein
MSDFHPAHPHDHFFRRTFDVLENLRALLRTQLPAGLLARLDLNSIQPAKDTFVGSEEHEKRLDLLYSARLVDGTEVLVICCWSTRAGSTDESRCSCSGMF